MHKQQKTKNEIDRFIYKFDARTKMRGSNMSETLSYEEGKLLESIIEKLAEIDEKLTLIGNMIYEQAEKKEEGKRPIKKNEEEEEDEQNEETEEELTDEEKADIEIKYAKEKRNENKEIRNLTR